MKLQEQSWTCSVWLPDKEFKTNNNLHCSTKGALIFEHKMAPFWGIIGAVTVAQWSSLFPESYHSYTAFLAV